MRCARLLVLVLSMACAVSPLLAIDPNEPLPDCPYLHVVDACQGDLQVYIRGEVGKRHAIPLTDGIYGLFEPNGVDFATTPDERANYSFVTQGPFLRIIDQRLEHVWRSVDVELDLDVPGLYMTKIEAGPPIGVDGDTVYPLYVSGRLVHPGYTEPVVVVLSQHALLANPLNLSQLLIAVVPICPGGGECRGTALDVAVGAALSGGDVRQQAYVSVMDVPPDGTRRHRFYRIDWGTDGLFRVGLDPWNDEGVPYDGLGHRSTGLDFDESGQRPFGLFKTLGVVTDLLDGTATCPIVGDATDIEVWGPGTDGPSSRIHFVTSLAAGGDVLLAFPEGECPDGDDDDLEIPVGDFPRALAIESSDEAEIWVYTANKDHGLSAVRIRIDADGSLTLEQAIDIPLAGCPSDVTFRDSDLSSCATIQGDPDQDPGGPDPPPDPCPPGSTDPACIEEDCPPEGCQMQMPGRRF